MKRTHTCGDLTEKEIGKEVLLQGWVSTRRDHGGVIFVDLRDRYGLTQVVFNPDIKDFPKAEKLRREDVIEIRGNVRNRPKNMENPKMKTGMIEVLVKNLEILNKAETPPLEVDDRVVAADEVRLKYRYLDLRRPIMQKLLQSRFAAAMAARQFLQSQGFIEIETPMLVRSTPEGARDYIVPSRVHPGKFYALPQSPQLYKQICMVAGLDKYFQFARCLRDEDLRMDRQPEHTQIDVEMSFVRPEDVFQVVEGIMKSIWETKGIKLQTPFPRIPYDAAMEKYGSDKPDLRYDLFLHDVTDIVKDSDFEVFKNVIKNGGIVKCINPEADFSRNEVDDLISFSQQQGSKGMAWMKITGKGLEGSIIKYFPSEIQKKLLEKTKAKKGYLFFIADSMKNTNAILDKLRRELARRLKLIQANDFQFCWITEFPLFEWNEEEEKWDPCHHMFCMPLEEDLKHLEDDPGKVKCTQYDIVLNGVELGSGSIRINRPDIQERVMKVIGLTHKDVERKFGFLIEAFKYGAPPHGGIGLGFDRVVTLLNGLEDIREVIAFPKNKAAECPMDQSPSEVEEKQLKELHLKLDVGKKK